MKLYKNLATALKEREEVRAIKLTLQNEFPQELFHFPQLEEVYLEGTCLQFPEKIQGWSQVKTLAIKWPNFKGELSPIFFLPSLENLKIIETPLKTIRLPLGQVGAPIKILTVKGCGLETLPEEIAMLSILHELSLPNNKLSELPHAFPDLRYLRRLNLDQNQFKHFPDLIEKMKGLRHLSIDGNKFSEDEKARIQRKFNLNPN